MSAASPFIASWGIIGTGWIATKFVEDLSIPCNDFTDVLHSITAVGSNDKTRAADFIERVCPKGGVAQQKGFREAKPEPCGSYAEVSNHKDVNIIYVGTLHPSHYNHARAALEAGKHCLVEKPATLNAAEWNSLSAIAKEKNLFLMEAVWTRFLPIIPLLQKALFEDKVIGDIRGVQATFGMNHDSTPLTHRLLDPAAAGGAMLDLGVYTLVPSLLALYHNPANNKAPPEKVHGTMVLGPSGCDTTTSITMTFPNLQALGVGTASFAMNSPKDQRCIISGNAGEVIFQEYVNRPSRFIIRKVQTAQLMPEWQEDVVVEAGIVGFGLVYEANEVARCVRDGAIESKVMPHDETKMVMGIFDLVREQNGYRFAKGMEQVQ